MADMIKLFDFKVSNDYKNDFKLSSFDKSNYQEKEPVQKNSENSFTKALENASQTIQSKEPQKETTESKNSPEKVENAEKKTQDLSHSINQNLKKLKENPAFKKAIEKFEKNLSSNTTLDELLKNLNQLIQSLMNLTQQGQNLAKVPQADSKRDQNLIQGLKNNLNQLKDLLKDDSAIMKQFTANINQGALSISLTEGQPKEKKIFDIKIEKGAKKNSEKKEEASKKENVKQDGAVTLSSENIKAKEMKDKLDSNPSLTDAKDKSITTKKQTTEKMVKNTDQESIVSKKDSEISNLFIQKFEQADKANQNESIRNIDKAQKAEIGKQIIDQIGEKVTGTISKNFSQITIQLRPEELGNVKIVLEMKNDTIKGRIVVENNEVRDIVQDNINQIKSVLQDSGVKLGELEVSTNSQGQSFEQQAKEDQFQKMVMQNQKVYSFLNQFETYEKGIEESYAYENNRIFLKA